MGRRRLPTPERKLHKKLSQERWKVQNWEYYVEQKRLLSGRLAYQAVRRARYKTRQAEADPSSDE